MNKSVTSLRLKNKIRQLKGTVRYSWQAMVSLFLVSFFLIYQVLFTLGDITNYVLIGSVLGSFLLFFVYKSPVFKMSGATLLYTYNTNYFYPILHQKMLIALLYSLLFALGISLLLKWPTFDYSLWTMLTLFALYINIGCLTSWLFYHGKGKLRLWAIVIFIVASSLFLTQNQIGGIGLFVLFIPLEVFVWKFKRLNIPKYFEQLKFIDMTTTAQSQNDYWKMMQLAEENRPSSVQGLKFQQFKPTKSWTLSVKATLELLRTQKQIFLLVVFFLLVGCLISRFDLFNHSYLELLVSTYCITMSAIILYQILAKKIKAALDKRLLGLSLPFAVGQIIRNYMVVVLGLNVILSLIISILYAKATLMILVFLLFGCLSFLFQCYGEISGNRWARQALSVAGIIVFWLGSLLFIFV